MTSQDAVDFVHQQLDSVSFLSPTVVCQLYIVCQISNTEGSLLSLVVPQHVCMSHTFDIIARLSCFHLYSFVIRLLRRSIQE